MNLARKAVDVGAVVGAMQERRAAVAGALKERRTFDKRRNLVGHCRVGSSDKIFILSVRDNSNGTFSVVGKWGSRGRIVGNQVKLTTESELAAYAERTRAFESIAHRKGYEDIEGPEYDGPALITEKGIEEFLEEDSLTVVTPIKPVVEKPKALPKEEDFVVECRDAAGIEELFDEGVEYVAERHEGADLIWVYDRVGERRECFRERFRLVEEPE